MIKNELVAGIVIIAIVVLVFGGLWYLSSAPTNASIVPDAIVVGTPPTESNALVYVAADMGFFRANDLNVTLKNYNTAVDAVAGLESGRADVSIMSEYLVVNETLNHQNLSVVGCIDKAQIQYLVGRRDRGIAVIEDLAGKKIGTHVNAIEEFYLGRLLDLHGIGLQNVTLVNVPPMQAPNALAKGSVDAAQVRQADLAAVEQSLGDNAVIWPSQNNQSAFQVIAGRADWVAANPSVAGRFLTALDQAEAYIVGHPAEAEAIVQMRLNYTDAYMATVWPYHKFTLSLDGSMVAAMEDEGRWMIANNLTAAKAIPDFTEFIDTRDLGKVKPEAVDLYL